jgi:pyrimidine-specific ribonucleoside hydrolase
MENNKTQRVRVLRVTGDDACSHERPRRLHFSSLDLYSSPHIFTRACGGGGGGGSFYMLRYLSTSTFALNRRIMTAQSNLTYIFDTDAGADDVMALAFLLSREDVEIEAITVCYGLAHGKQGAINLSKIISLAGKEIPVFVGPEMPLENVGQVPFPDEWRVHSDQLPGVDLPEFYIKPRQEPAQTYLQRRLRDGTRPVKILALGALTTLASLEGNSMDALREVVYMGGAFDVPGNIHSYNEFVTPTVTAEWNVFVDPTAASRVFSAGTAPMLVVPLDATSKVPIDVDFINEFAAMDLTPLGLLTAQVLESVRVYAERGEYYAWDMLAAVAMLERSVVQTVDHPVNVNTLGTTRRAATGSEVSVAYNADSDRFRIIFVEAFLRKESKEQEEL